MKKFSKRSKVALGIVAVILLFFCYYSYRTRLWEQNVFDQMYYSRVHQNSEFSDFASAFGYYRKLFKDMPQLCKQDNDDDDRSIELLHTVEEQYDDNFLENGHEIKFTFYINEPVLRIEYRLYSPGGWDSFAYHYDVDKKTLTYETSDPKNTSMKHFLFDRVLPEWFVANRGRTRFSAENLGKDTFIDPTAEVQYETYSIKEKRIVFDDVFISYPVFVSDGSPFEDAVNARLFEELCLGLDEEELRNYKGCQVFDGSYIITFANEDIVSICLHLYAIQGLGPGIEYWKGITFSISEQRFLHLSDFCTWEDLVQCVGTPEDLLERVPEIWRFQYAADKLPSEIDWDGEDNFYLGPDYIGLTLLNMAASPLETVVFEVPFDWSKKE